jgi:hypothetical protein
MEVEFCVGSAVGSMLGSEVCCVGTALGSTEGSAVGINVGAEQPLHVPSARICGAPPLLQEHWRYVRYCMNES